MRPCARYLISEILVDDSKIAEAAQLSGILVTLELITVMGRQMTRYPQKNMPSPNPKKITNQIGSRLFVTRSR